MSHLFIEKQAWLMLSDFQEEPSSMCNGPCSDLEEMESQDPQASRPPGLGQCFPCHHREAIAGEDVESPPGRISKEALRREDTSCQIIFEDIVDFFYGLTSFSLPLQQSLPIPAPHVGEYGKIVIKVSVPKSSPWAGRIRMAKYRSGFILFLLEGFV